MRSAGALVLVVVLAACQAPPQLDPQTCAQAAIGPERLVGTDASQHRYFVTGMEPAALYAVADAVRPCLAGTDWAGRWSLSLFSDPQMAGYKDEPRLVPFHEDGQWAAAYQAEYDAAADAVTLDPASAPRLLER